MTLHQVSWNRSVSDFLNSPFVPSHKTLLQCFGKPEAKTFFFLHGNDENMST